jgi:hypothetical protein
MCKKESYVVNAAIVVAVVTMLFFPVTGTAGSLDPSAAPAPTMKTLDQIPPTWSQKISGAARFELVLDGVAVLDKETGLVWERTPSGYANNWTRSSDYCAATEVGGRKGWHLPTIEQLASLVDTSVAGYPKLPAGHPFTVVESSYYWSATTLAGNSANAWNVFFLSGSVYSVDKTSSNYVWCVRGGQGYEGQ